MKVSHTLFLILFTFVSIIFGSAFIENFQAESDGDNIILTWNSLSETNVKSYEILRGPDRDNLSLFANVIAKGDNSTYSFIDQSAYKSSSNFYAYGLVIVDNNGSRSTITHTRVDHNVSSVKRTWGSIKALFR